jgi:hypothetical protein
MECEKVQEMLYQLNPNLNHIILDYGELKTCELNVGSVRIYVNKNNIVMEQPSIG